LLYFCCTGSQNRLRLSHPWAYFRSVFDIAKPLTIWPTDKLTSLEIRCATVDLVVIAADCCTFAVLGRKIALAVLDNEPILSNILGFLKLMILCPTNKPTSFEMGLFCAPRGTRTLVLLVRNPRPSILACPWCPNVLFLSQFSLPDFHPVRHFHRLRPCLLYFCCTNRVELLNSRFAYADGTEYGSSDATACIGHTKIVTPLVKGECHCPAEQDQLTGDGHSLQVSLYKH
jgi:hypothetical protein